MMTPKQVRIFLDLLVADNMIEKGTDKGKPFTLITICNYGRYQDNTNIEGKDRGNDRATIGQRQGNDRATTKEVKEDKNVKKLINNIGFDPEFLSDWNNWKAFRKELGLKAYKQIGEQAALSKLNNLSKNNVNVARKIINQSIENGWRGFFPINDNEQPKKLVRL